MPGLSRREESGAASSNRLAGRLREIVDRAAELFDQFGYHNVTMEDVARQVGLRKPTLYHYVPSKAELLFLIHREFMDLVISRAKGRESIDMPASQQLLEVMGDILELMQSHRGHVRVFFEHHRELPQHYQREIYEERDRYEKMVSSIIEKGIERGEFKPIDVHLATFGLFGMCNWAYQWYRPSGSLRPRDIAYVFWGVLMNGMTNRVASSTAMPAARAPLGS